MTIQDLQTIFQDQVNTLGYIVVSAESIESANLTAANQFDQLIKSYLLLELPPPLTVVTDTIPSPVGNTLTIVGNANVVNLTDVAVSLVFSVDDNNVTNLLLTVELANEWTLYKSFPTLPTYPISLLSFRLPTYLFTTESEENYTWHNQVLILEQGLNFSGYLLLTGRLEILSLFVDSVRPDDEILFIGTIDPTAMTQPTNSLYPTIYLSGTIPGKADLPGFTVQNPQLLLSIYPDAQLMDTGITSTFFQFWLYFAVDLKIGEGDNALWIEFKAPFLKDSQTYSFNLVAEESDSITIASIVSLLNSNFMEAIPEIIQDLFLDSISLQEFNASFYIPENSNSLPTASSMGASIGTKGTWNIGIFSIENISLHYTLLFAESNTNVLASFTAQFQFYAGTPPDPDPYDPNPPDDALFPGYFDVEMTQPDVNQLIISANYTGNVYLDKLIEVMSGNTLSVPEALHNVVFSDFGVYFTSDTNGSTYGFFGNVDMDFDIDILGTSLTMNFQVAINWLADKTVTYMLNGGLTIGEEYFALELDFNSQEQKLVAAWTVLDDNYLGLNDLAHALNLPMFAIPAGVDLNMQAITFSYDFNKEAMVLEASSASYGQALFISQNVAAAGAPAQWEYFFIFEFQTSGLEINSLPLFGTLPPGQTISLDTLQISGASNIITADQMPEWEALVPSTLNSDPNTDSSFNFKLPPSIDYPGVSITAKVILGTVTVELFLPLSTGSPPQPEDLSWALSTGQEASSTPINPLTVWIKVQNSLGPIYLNRIGFSYQAEKFCILLDASIELTSLTIDVLGLGVSVNLKNLEDLSFSIQGLGISFTQPPLQISGGFLRMPDDGTGNLEFDGEVILAMPELKVLGIGSYSTLAGTSDCSLFVLALLNEPLGGSPYFYVTGIAAGFGYNRALKIPVQSDVQNFPLVAGLSTPSKLGGTHPTPNQALATLADWTPAVQGQYWFAVGVQGTTFEIINTNALFIVQFGKKTLISIIGISTLKQPQTGPTFAYAALDISANFSPDEGEILITAVLAPGAYVLTPSAKLKGGFAFASWFGNNPHAGDFVFTIGGYSQYFTPPAYYPTVPSVALDWKIAAGMSFTGTAYFAIVPSAMMAGVNIQYSYNAGPLKAWLKVRADVVLFWKPFYFIADVSVSVGVSLRMKVVFVTITVSAEVNAIFHLWGPDMGGSVHVDWCILAFTISFGASKRTTSNSITWEEFQEMLPSKTYQPDTSKNALTETPPIPSYVYINVNEGLTNSKTLADGQHWLVNAEQFKLSVSAALPASQISINSIEIQGKQVGMPHVEQGISPQDYQCEQTITIVQVFSDDIEFIHQCMISYPEYNPEAMSSTEAIDMQNWNIGSLEASLPTAMWSDIDSLKENSSSQTITAVVGAVMHPDAPTSTNGTPPMEIEKVFSFQIINQNDMERLSIDPNTPQEDIVAYEADSFIDIKQINDDTVSTARTQVYDMLVALGITGLANDSLAEMAKNPGAAFVDEPREGTTISN